MFFKFFIVVFLPGSGVSGGHSPRAVSLLRARDPRPGLSDPRLLQPARHLLRVSGPSQRRVSPVLRCQNCQEQPTLPR